MVLVNTSASFGYRLFTCMHLLGGVIPDGNAAGLKGTPVVAP